MSLFVSTSNGIFSVNPDTESIRHVLKRKHTSGLFSRRAKGYFGICNYANNKVMAASKEVMGTTKSNKPTSDCKLHLIFPDTGGYEYLASVYDVHDVHQIEYYDGFVFLTDTGKNRIVVYDLEKQIVKGYLDIGKRRFDINHVNAVKVFNGILYIGLNYAEPNSKILLLHMASLEVALDCSDIMDIVDVITIPGCFHTHDLVECDDKLLVCSSADARLVDAYTGRQLWAYESWLRGIAVTENHVWVGQSVHAKRRKRHSKKLAGYLHKLDRNTFEFQGTVTISKVGQINDMVYAG
ncbi:hypothetical protein [Thiohalophilus sp.]|uniref:hypothetical protein n=1 Tax=Thiohalophilus sp. TaxID=3028392 RepID=UPI002ACD5DC1|nr:hypothetical protein [Thiohalophilus sp.]MDZ7804193.1 hypothetical protein [Thiohalophilus sp.]